MTTRAGAFPPPTLRGPPLAVWSEAELLPRTALARGIGRERRNLIRLRRVESRIRRPEVAGTIEGRAGVRAAPAPPMVFEELFEEATGHVAEQLLDRQQALRVRHLEQPKFQVEALLLLVSQFAVGSQHDLQMTREIFFAE